MGNSDEIMEKCKKATFLIEKSQFTSLSLWEFISLKRHLFNCALCTLYSKQTLVINAMIRDLFKEKIKPEVGLDPEIKEKMQTEINSQIR